jgi:hypothetical protein
MSTCVDCGRNPATVDTVAGRARCASCASTVAGTVSALATGSSPAQAVGTGLASGRFASALAGEAAARQQRQQKLAATTGRWRRLWVRLIG